MTYRIFSLGALALALLVGNARAFAADEAKISTHDGSVVSITSKQLVMTNKVNKERKEHSHMLTPDTKLTLDGKACKAEDIKAGTKIRVTTKKGESTLVSQIEAIDKNEKFANTHDGKIISIVGNKLVMTGAEGKGEHTCTLTADVQVTCDGEICKASDLKPGMKIRVTSENQEPHAATQIEALNKNPTFASL